VDDSFDKTIAENGKEEAHRYQLPEGSILGMYRVIRALGRGSMGEVYEVKHEVLTIRYAIKLLPSAFQKQRGFLERFKREAQVMARLNHPNIIKVDDFGETNGKLWLRMELAEGIEFKGKQIVTLGEYAEALGGKIPQEELVEYLVQILEGLQYAHQRGAIHRDLKPANILFSSQLATDNRKLTTVKISDFGLVRLVGEEWVRSRAEQSISLTMSLGDEETEGIERSGSSTRALLGTYEYMSPEQKRGEPADERSDIYAIGLMTFRFLTGRKELEFELPSQIEKGLSPAWDKLVQESLRSQKEKRMASASRMLETVQGIKEKLAVHEPAPASTVSVFLPSQEKEPSFKQQIPPEGEVSSDKDKQPPPPPTRNNISFIIILLIILVIAGLFLARDFIFKPQKETEVGTVMTTIQPEAFNKESTTSSVPKPETTTVLTTSVTTTPVCATQLIMTETSRIIG
jgi:serine/threonine-protein kinase